MAQPLANVPPFCLTIFGSDNKYDSMDVENRWKYTVAELAKIGVDVLVISSDSDPRYNRVMRNLSRLGEKTQIDWFSSVEKFEPPMRNFVLSSLFASKIVPFGNSFISLSHLHEIMEKFPKDRDLLTPSTLNPLDRQNFDSVLRMCHERVTVLLRDHVKNSDGTYTFLQMMRDIISCFMDFNLTPLQRIRKIWYCVFVIRMWRKFILESENFTLKNNFMSSNCYVCIELNAHEIVKCLIHLKDINKPEYFYPYLFGSQACESTFRQLRSSSTTYSTVVNCSLKESISRVSKMQFQNDITHNTSSSFVYPRVKKTTTFPIQFELPNKKEIYDDLNFVRS